jgi:hypothetical protein
MPSSVTAIISNVVATGRLMKGVEKLTEVQSRVLATTGASCGPGWTSTFAPG